MPRNDQVEGNSNINSNRVILIAIVNSKRLIGIDSFNVLMDMFEIRDHYYYYHYYYSIFMLNIR